LLVFVCQFDILIYSISMNMNNSNIINLVHKHNIQVMCIYFSLLIYSSCFNSILVYFSYLCLFFNSLLFRFSLDLLFSMLNVMYLNCLYKLLMLEFNITNYTLMFYNQIIFNLWLFILFKSLFIFIIILFNYGCLFIYGYLFLERDRIINQKQ